MTSATFPEATATRFIEFSNIGTRTDAGATGVAGISSGAIVMIGLNGATAFQGGAGTTLGSMYLNLGANGTSGETSDHGATGFCGLLLPGDISEIRKQKS
jgi:hypothetical protein